MKKLTTYSIFILFLILLSPSAIYAQELIFSDDFDRTVSSGWGSNSGYSYLYNGIQSTFSTSGSTGFMQIPAGGNYSSQIEALTSTDTEITYLMSFNQAVSGGTQDGYVTSAFLRYVNGSNNYRIEFRFLDNNSISIGAAKEVTDIVTSLGGTQVVSGITYVPSARYYVKARVTGSNPATVQGKIWADGVSEPTGWQYTTTDTEAALSGAGGFGVRGRIPSQSNNAPVTMTVDELSVYTYDLSVGPTPATVLEQRGYFTTGPELQEIRTKANASTQPYSTTFNNFDSRIGTPTTWTYGNIDGVISGGNDLCDGTRNGPNYLSSFAGGREIYAKALAYHLYSNDEYAAYVKTRILDLTNTTGWGGETYGGNNQCILNLSFSIPLWIAAADLIEGYSGWTTADKYQFQQWLADEVYKKTAWASRVRKNNWGAAGSVSSAMIADYL